MSQIRALELVLTSELVIYKIINLNVVGMGEEITSFRVLMGQPSAKRPADEEYRAPYYEFESKDKETTVWKVVDIIGSLAWCGI